MPNNIVTENENYKNLNRNAFASCGSYDMVQLNLETHYTQKKWVTSNLLQGKDDANKCKLGGITQVD